MKANTFHLPPPKSSLSTDADIKSNAKSDLKEFSVYKWVLLVFIISSLQIVISTFSIQFLDEWSIDVKNFADHSVVRNSDGEPNHVRMPQRRNQQVLILMASPGTPQFKNLEQNLYLWNKEFKLRPWSWAIPDISPTIYNQEDGFKPFIESVYFLATSPPRGYDGFNRTAKTKSDFFVKQFSRCFLFEWMKNKHLLISSDKFHLLQEGENSVRKLLQLLPWRDNRFALYGSDRDVKVAVLYPIDRFDHILRFFQSVAPPELTFLEWLSHLEDLSSFDVLSLAQSIQDEGISVEVLPFSNTESNSLNKLIICNVLGAVDCVNEETPKFIDNDEDDTKSKYEDDTKSKDEDDTESNDEDDTESDRDKSSTTRDVSLPNKTQFLRLLSDYECSFQFMTMCSSEVSTQQARDDLINHIRSYKV